MKVTAILNGCQNDFFNQLEEMIGFSMLYLTMSEVRCIVFLHSEDEIAKYHAMMPFGQVIYIEKASDDVELDLSTLERVEVGTEQECYLFPSNLWGNAIATRFSCRKNGSAINSVMEMVQFVPFTVKKMVYGATVLATMVLEAKPYCVTLAKKQFGATLVEQSGTHKVPYEWVEATDFERREHNILRSEAKGEVKGLEQAKFIVACGSGGQSKENVERLAEQSERIGATFGVSRPVAMSNWYGLDQIIGVSGSICKSELCIVLGASGAGAFLAGIDKSQYIIAVNIDEKASIMKQADVKVVGDCIEFMDLLCAKIEQIERD